MEFDIVSYLMGQKAGGGGENWAPLRNATVVFDFAQFLNNVSWTTSAEEKEE